jgi:hypothetical protein
LKRDLRDKRVRVRGTLVPGSLCRLEPDCGYRFSMADPSWYADDASSSGLRPRLPVSFEGCVVPDPLLEHTTQELPVVVEGQRCQSCHDFQATTVMAPIYSPYEYPSDAAPPALPLPRCNALTPRM